MNPRQIPYFAPLSLAELDLQSRAIRSIKPTPITHFMPEFTGKLVEGDRVVYAAVKGEYEVDDFMSTWSGSFNLVSAELPDLQDKGTLVLEDAALQGDIVITRIALGTETVEFRGVKGLPDPVG